MSCQVSSKMCRLTRDASFHRTAIFKSGKTWSSDVVRYLRRHGTDLRELHLIQFHGIQGIVRAATSFADQLKILKVCTSTLARPLKALEVLTNQSVLPNLEELHIHVHIKGHHAIVMSHIHEDHDIMKALCKNRWQFCINLNVKFCEYQHIEQILKEGLIVFSRRPLESRKLSLQYIRSPNLRFVSVYRLYILYLFLPRGTIIKNIDWNAPYFSESSDIALASMDSCTSLNTLRICGYLRPMSNHFFRKLSALTNLTQIMIGQCRLENTDLLRFFKGK